jgi:hypothetical protein
MPLMERAVGDGALRHRQDRCRRRRNIRGENGATVSLREVDIDITFGCERDGVKKSLGGWGYEASGSELTAIHEGVDVALRQRFFQTVLRGAG